MVVSCEIPHVLSPNPIKAGIPSAPLSIVVIVIGVPEAKGIIDPLPFAPVGPVGPVGPVAPVAPFIPFAPVGPVAPVTPVGPIGPVAPVKP